ncbi:hypothetical protein METP3_02830 [Methanosarcinales archaeon]|nr:hypothetical protein METP3_02830 [Methanosarcinales archaeon]
MDLNYLLVSTIPSLIIAGLITGFLAYRTYKQSNEKQLYKMDKFRLNLESQIVNLQNQLSINQDRFEQINHLLLSSQTGSLEKKPKLKSNAFLERRGINQDVKIETDLIFVLMPFNPEFDATYNVIKRVSEEAGFRCLRGDEEKTSGDILPHILQLIVKSRLIIANITGRNSNVFYELGIAHSIGKEVMLISETVEDMPFDISHIRILTFRDAEELSNKLKNWLINTFARIEQ